MSSPMSDTPEPRQTRRDAERPHLMTTADQATELQQMTDEQLLPFLIADELRNRQAARGIKTLLQPWPPCPACGAPIDEILDRADRLLRWTVLGFRPCGHLYTVPAGTAMRLADAVRAAVDEKENRPAGEPSARTTPNNPPASTDTANNPAPSMLASVLTEHGVSQADLARRTDLSTKHINQLCQGTARMSVDVALRLEVVLGVDAEEWLRADTTRRVAEHRDAATIALLRPLHRFIEGLKQARLNDERERQQLAGEADTALGIARALKDAADRARALHRPVTDRTGWGPDDDTTPGTYGNVGQACAECGSGDNAVRWPCPTVRILDAAVLPAPAPTAEADIAGTALNR